MVCFILALNKKKKDIVNKAEKNKKKNEERQHTLG
jgi:hypothetical protein